MIFQHITLLKATGKTWRITNRSSNSGVSTNIMFSDNLVGTTGQFNKGNSGATINYYIYYKKSFMRIFVNSNGQKNYTTIRIHTRKANGY